MTRSATPKLGAYALLAAVALVTGLFLGRVELVVFAVPFITVLVLALLLTEPPVVDVALMLSETRVIEGDELEATVSLTSDRPIEELELGLVQPRGIEIEESPRCISLTLTALNTLVSEEQDAQVHREEVFRLRTNRWGARKVGVIALRVTGPGRLVSFENVIDAGQSLNVYPASESVSRSVSPSHTQMYSGDYAARLSGDGIEFATVRPFVRGDSIRRVNWRVSSRTQELHVNLAHPERNADVVLFLDTFADIDLRNGTVLDLTVRGAAALAQYHLRHNDRVGLVSFGGMMRWLTASMGRVHAYRIADFVLDVNATFSFAWKDIELLPPGILPPSAVVIAFSPLVDPRAIRALGDIGARGFSLAIINTLSEHEVDPTPTQEGVLSHRLWILQREKVRDEFRSRGIPVVTWTGDTGIEAAVAAIPRRDRRVREVHK
jgi:uncharacterized protein (DUF58 family)